MKILLDMNLPPAWVDFLENEGFQAIHWANVGPYDASDKEIRLGLEKVSLTIQVQIIFSAILLSMKLKYKPVA